MRNVYMYKYICIYIYMSFLFEYEHFRQCQWNTSTRSQRELSNAIVKSGFRHTGVEMRPFLFQKGVTYGELAMEAGGTRDTEPGEPRAAAMWSLHLKQEQ